MNGSFKEGRHSMEKGGGMERERKKVAKLSVMQNTCTWANGHVLLGGPVGRPGNYPSNNNDNRVSKGCVRCPITRLWPRGEGRASGSGNALMS
jgi:hypothetical protein